MFRCVTVCVALLLPALGAIPAGSASSTADPSVKLWVDAGAENACEQATPASGDWMIRNNEGRNVHIVLHRVLIKGNATTEDQMKDTIGPRETREMGCEISDDGHQTLTVVKTSF